MPTVEEGIRSQLCNIEKTYGKTIDELVAAIGDSGLVKHNDVVAMLKQRYGMSHAAAHRVSLTARDRGRPAGDGAGVAPSLQAVYSRLLHSVTSLGNDIEQAPKKGYLSLRRRKQFAMLQPGARWINVGLVLPHHAPLAGSNQQPNGMRFSRTAFGWRMPPRSTRSSNHGFEPPTTRPADQREDRFA
jgi:hypothetical protein